jgi:hypothetical protein
MLKTIGATVQLRVQLYGKVESPLLEAVARNGC